MKLKKHFQRACIIALAPALWLGNARAAVASETATALPSPIAQHARPHGSGISYTNPVIEDVPWSIWVVKIDRSHADLHFETTMGAGTHMGMSTVSEQVKAMPAQCGKALAAVNGDFYKSHDKYPGDPEGLQIIRGELVSAPRATHSCFWIDASGNPCLTNIQGNFAATLPGGSVLPFGLNEERGGDDAVLYTSANGLTTRTSGGLELVLARGAQTNWLPLRAGETYNTVVREIHNDGDSTITPDTMVLSLSPKVAGQLPALKPGDAVKISTETTPSVAGAMVGIGGGPALARGGKATKFSGLQPRQPRTALGWNKNYFFFVEVDGRQKTSAGMTFPELADYMVGLGCTEAINLDGGGSATIWVLGTVMNNPSEGHERPAANALVLMQKNPAD